MDFITKITDKYCLISISGRLDSYTTPQMNTCIQDLKSLESRFVIIDLSQIDYISSSGLLTLVQSQKYFKDQDIGEILLAGAPDMIYHSFVLAGFDKIFRFYNNVQSAIDNIEFGGKNG